MLANFKQTNKNTKVNEINTIWNGTKFISLEQD